MAALTAPANPISTNGTMTSSVVPMDVDDVGGTNDAGREEEADAAYDLVGSPFAVIESDPGVFTNLVRRLGIRDVELVELYGIEPWAVAHLKPHGLIFCFLWHKDPHRAKYSADPAAEKVWFANQLNDDACASFAILNVLLNCPTCDIGERLKEFRADTEQMSSVMKGLAISNSDFVRNVHNSLARPSDIRGALSALAASTTEDLKRTAKPAATSNSKTKEPPTKRRKTAPSPPAAADLEESFHFIGYVPVHGKVWELDGLQPGPVEVGEIPVPEPRAGDNTQAYFDSWMDVARPALRMKMKKYGGAAEDGGNIRFNLLAIVEDQYQVASDGLEMLKREKAALERRLDAEYPDPPGWRQNVDPALLAISEEVFATAVESKDPGSSFSSSFGHNVLHKQKAVLDLPEDELTEAWNTCIGNAKQAKIAVEDELSKARTVEAERISRTHDYEPFIREYLAALHSDGLLNPLLGRDEHGRAIPATPAKARKKPRR